DCRRRRDSPRPPRQNGVARNFLHYHLHIGSNVRLLRQRTMNRVLFAFAMLLAFGVMKLPAEHALSLQHRSASGGQSDDIANLDLREKIGQLGFVAALSGFRAMLADFFFFQAPTAWERNGWGRVLFLFRPVTTLQPHGPLFLDVAAWHLAGNAGGVAVK